MQDSRSRPTGGHVEGVDEYLVGRYSRCPRCGMAWLWGKERKACLESQAQGRAVGVKCSLGRCLSIDKSGRDGSEEWTLAGIETAKWSIKSGSAKEAKTSKLHQMQGPTLLGACPGGTQYCGTYPGTA